MQNFRRLDYPPTDMLSLEKIYSSLFPNIRTKHGYFKLCKFKYKQLFPRGISTVAKYMEMVTVLYTDSDAVQIVDLFLHLRNGATIFTMGSARMQQINDGKAREIGHLTLYDVTPSKPFTISSIEDNAYCRSETFIFIIWK